MSWLQIPERLVAVEQAIAIAANVSVEQIRGERRDRAIVDARHAVWFVAREVMGYSYPRIGDFYDRDHTTIMNGVARIRQSKVSDKIINGLRKVCPEAMTKISPEEGKSFDDWDFEVGKTSGKHP
jgi:hypothetical protein